MTPAARSMHSWWNGSRRRFWQAPTRRADIWSLYGIWPQQRALAQLETEGLVRTERTAGRYVTEDTGLLEQLREESARMLAEDFLEKMRGIGYSPAQAAALLERWDAKEEHDE